jgi:cytoskeletal protein CcmA (bactofilin family)
VKGNVSASERIEILHQGKVTGDILAPRLLIEDGAYTQGSIDVATPQSEAPRKLPARARVIIGCPSFLAVSGGE